MTTSLDINHAAYYADYFCGSNGGDSRCPDGTVPSATNFERTPGLPTIIANGTNAHLFTLKARDQYGNRTGSGDSWIIPHIATVKNIQPINEDNNFTDSPEGDAYITDLTPMSVF